MKTIAILGSTGSIGVNTLKVLGEHREEFRVLGLAAGQNITLLEQQIKEFRPRVVSLADEERAEKLRKRVKRLGVKVLHGHEGLDRVATIPDVDMVVSTLVGSTGLIPTIKAIHAGKQIALANKEILVMAGEIIMREIQEKTMILPIDSEHSAIFQSLAGENRASIRRLILTASGGPFRRFSSAELQKISPQEALKHPIWNMGRKNTIDSATLMNKGLEIIEAKWLFDVESDQIDVVIHPQSIIHSMVEFVDGSLIAQLGIPDMRIPISYALNYPDRLENHLPQLDLVKIRELTFEGPNLTNFPCLSYAFMALKAGRTMPAVLNASNEIAVEAFLKEEISFCQIPEIIHETMRVHTPLTAYGLEEIFFADQWARERARSLVTLMQRS
ncbi:MAG: 1-deoxy-D-xylulose-5-phosphate reductoisomerase [Candidatus Tectomicrobia bacterium]|nr:1-deoxy-D-xylulose-5-phosphate reductoisomerase [Candidatus Tectomicrobia bacterium]